MGNRILEFTLPFLLFAALCLGAAVLKKKFVISSEAMNWTDARMYCQMYHTDLVTLNTVDEVLQTEQLLKGSSSVLWIGLHRDPANDSVWKWIDVETGNGITGDDLSKSSYWTSGQQSSLCAYVANDQLWYSDLCLGLHSVYCSQGNDIQYYKGSGTWDQAFQFCRKYNSTLATISTTNKNYLNGDGWIGLYRVGDTKWSWIGDQSSTYTNWAPGEPTTPDCGIFYTPTDMWYSGVCSRKFYFICSDDNLVVVNENKTWEEALSYCNTITTSCQDSSRPCIYSYKLLSLQYSSDYSYVRGRMYKVTTNEVWMGLRFLGGEWWWVNGQVLEDEECPSLQNHCGTLSKYGTYTWTTRDCLERRNFICLKYRSYT